MFFKENSQRKKQNKSHQKQSKIISKDIGKLIFRFDEESQVSNDEKEDAIYSSLSKLERLKRIKQEQCKKVKPSIMFEKKQDSNYVLENKQSDTKKQRIRQSKTLRKFEIYDQDEDKPNKQPQQMPEHENSSSIILNPQNKNKPCISLVKCHQQNNNKNQNIKTAKQQQVNSIVQKNIQHNSKLARSQTLKSKRILNNQFLFQIQSDGNDIVEQSNKSQIHSSTTTCAQQKFVNLLYPDAHAIQVNKHLSKRIGQFQDYHNIRVFLETPIPNQVYFEFQVHKYKNFMKTQYLFWLNYGESMALLASATNNTLFIQKNIFKLQLKSLHPQSPNQQITNTLIGLFVSDFKRQTYTLYDHQNYEKPTQNDKVLCTVATIQNFVHPKLKSQQLYIPKIVNEQCTNIFNNSLSKNLKKLYKIQQFKNMIEKLSTHTVSKKIIQKIKQQSKICVNTTRNAIVKDEDKQARFIMYKVQHNRFKIRAISGLNPIQLFSYAIVHLE